MKRSTFLFISAMLAFVFGGMMFFVPALAAQSLGIEFMPVTASLLRGMGGLIIGSGVINFLVRSSVDNDTLKAVLLTNIITHLLGLSADIWGLSDGVLTAIKMAPVEITHLFCGVGAFLYLVRLRHS